MLIHTQVEAHKVILAASGPFFHAILKKNKHPHPLVFMRGVKLEGLVNLVCSESGTQTFVESETIESEIEERCTGEKPFVCTQCSYSSTTADNLKTHLRIHSGEKPFSCTQCEFSCTRVSYLKKHMLEHSGEKPFRCDQWNYSCARATMPLLRQAIWGHIKKRTLGKVRQMQPMRLCILSGMLFEDTFEKHTVEKSQTNVRRANVLQPSQAGILWGHLKLHGGGKQEQTLGTPPLKIVWRTPQTLSESKILFDSSKPTSRQVRDICFWRKVFFSGV